MLVSLSDGAPTEDDLIEVLDARNEAHTRVSRSPRLAGRWQEAAARSLPGHRGRDHRRADRARGGRDPRALRRLRL